MYPFLTQNVSLGIFRDFCDDDDDDDHRSAMCCNCFGFSVWHFSIIIAVSSVCSCYIALRFDDVSSSLHDDPFLIFNSQQGDQLEYCCTFIPLALWRANLEFVRACRRFWDGSSFTISISYIMAGLCRSNRVSNCSAHNPSCATRHRSCSVALSKSLSDL